MNQDCVLVVSMQEYQTPSTGGMADAPTWIAEGFSSSGWKATSGNREEISVKFVDGRSQAGGGGDYPQIEGISIAADVPVVATVLIPVTVLRFRQGATYCSAEVADVATPLAQTWASQVTQASAMHPVGRLGMGQADEKGVTLTTGAVLIRGALWEEGVAGGSSRDAPSSRAIASRILDALATASDG